MLIDSSRLTDADRDFWRRWAATRRLDVRRLEALEARAAGEVAAFDRPRRYVSVSWGKDSVVTAAIVRRVSPSVPIVWCTTGLQTNPDCREVRDAYLSEWPTPYTEVDVDPGDLADDGERKTARQQARAGANAEHGCRITGVRAAESSAREMSARVHGVATQETCRPILRWSTEDVFAYLIWRDLPIHPAYAMTMGGLLDPLWLRVGTVGGDRGGERRRMWEQAYYGNVLSALH